MDTIPDIPAMDKQPPLAGLDPADLLRRGLAQDTLDEAEFPGFSPPPPEELAPKFPQFEILELIGQGGMGAVYKVRQKDLDRVVALKILPPVIGRSPEFSKRFTREARALAKLNHPGIVTIHEFGHQDGLHFILMEFVDGVSLAQLMKTGRVSPREALAIVPQICDALQYAHDHGIVHRDIKPENILLDRLGRVKVADFGIAKMASVAAVCDRRTEEGDEVRRSQTAAAVDQTIAGKVMGTPAYMAPEQIVHPSEVDHRADIYALGIVFYQMLTGELPGRELEPPSRKVAIDVRLDEVVLRALERKPELRYQQASALKTRLETLSEEPSAGAPARPVAITSSHMVAVPLFLLLYLLLLGLLAITVPDLPGTVATHFDNEGRPNGWMSRAAYLCFVGALPLLFSGLAAGIGWMTRTLPARFINIPRRDFWLTPGRRPSLAAFLRARMFLLACLATGFFAGLHALTVQANRFQPPHLSMGGLLGIVMGFLILVLLWTTSLLMRLADVNQSLPMPDVGTGTPSSHSRMVRLIETVVDTRFTAPLAIKLINLAGIGFLGCLGFVGYVALPHTRPLFALWGLFGLFGLLGFAFPIEKVHRRRQAGSRPDAPSGQPRYWRVVLLGVVLLVVSFLVWEFGVTQRKEDRAVNTAAAGKPGSATPVMPAFSFGPVIERVVNDDRPGAEKFLIDLDSGHLVTPPSPKEADWNWTVAHGIDAIGCTDANVRGLLATGGTVVVPVASDAWEAFSVNDVRQIVVPLSSTRQGGVAMPGKDRLPSTYAFKTREDGIGLLQIVVVNDDPPCVDIRYKLVRKAEAKASGAPGLPGHFSGARQTKP